MAKTDLLSDTVNKLYHLKEEELRKANHLISELLTERPVQKKRVGGKYRGQFVMKENFNDPLPQDVLDGFNGLKPWTFC